MDVFRDYADKSFLNGKTNRSSASSRVETPTEKVIGAGGFLLGMVALATMLVALAPAAS